MALRSEASLAVGLGTAAIVYTLYSSALPPVADVRASGMNDSTISGTERMTTWVAAGVVTGVALLSRDATVFILGGAAVVACAWMHRHANAVNPATGMASTNSKVRTPNFYGNV